MGDKLRYAWKAARNAGDGRYGNARYSTAGAFSGRIRIFVIDSPLFF